MSHVSFSSFDATMSKETVLEKEKKEDGVCVHLSFRCQLFPGRVEKKQVGNKTWRNLSNVFGGINILGICYYCHPVLKQKRNLSLFSIFGCQYQYCCYTCVAAVVAFRIAKNLSFS